MSREIDEAQRRIDTGWRLDYSEKLKTWLLRRYNRRGKVTVCRWFDTATEAQTAYLAVTSPDSHDMHST